MIFSLIHPKALDICTDVGRNTPPQNWNTIAKNMDMTKHTLVGRYSLKYGILGRLSFVIIMLVWFLQVDVTFYIHSGT